MPVLIFLLSSVYSPANAALAVGQFAVLKMPVYNLGAKDVPLQNARLAVTKAPPWFTLNPRHSKLGPVTIAPGDKFIFEIAFFIGEGFSTSSLSEIDFSVTTDNDELKPGSMTCQLRSVDGFRTQGKICQDSKGEEIVRDLIFDVTPPVTTVSLMLPSYADAKGRVFISTASPIGIDATDPVNSYSKTSGVTWSGYAMDQSRPLDSLSQLTPYEAPFCLPSEGSHTLFYASRDAAGNEEVIRSTTVIADGTPPVTQATFSMPYRRDSHGNLILPPSTMVTLSGVDPKSGGVASGFSRTIISVDYSDGILYKGPFSLPRGYHRLSFGGVDNAENSEPVHVLGLFVGVAVDTQPPVTKAQVLGTSAAVAEGLVVLCGSSLTFTSADLPADISSSGIDKTYYLFDVSPKECAGGTPDDFADSRFPCGSCQNGVFRNPVPMPLGAHTIRYFSVDAAGNIESVKSIAVRVVRSLNQRTGGP